MITVNDVVKIMERIVPHNLALDWDNPGLQIGRLNSPVQAILFALDLTSEVLEQALAVGVNLIITHHPLLFHKLSQVVDVDWQQDLVLRCAENHMAVFSAHTNWDVVDGGVNDVLAQGLGLRNVEALDRESGIGRIGYYPICPLTEFAQRVKYLLGLKTLMVADAGKPVYKVAVCGGSGADFINLALEQECDTYLTADLRYHEVQKGVFSGLNMLDGTHQATEQLSMEFMLEQFRQYCCVPVYLSEERQLMRMI